MRDLSTLSGPKLETLIARLDAAHSDTLRAAIANGYGNATLNDMRAKHASEPIAAAHIAASDDLAIARSELDQRMRWQGNNRPIKAPRLN